MDVLAWLDADDMSVNGSCKIAMNVQLLATGTCYICPGYFGVAPNTV